MLCHGQHHQKAHKPPTPYDNYTYYKPCTQNMTLENYKENKRCAMPLLSQQWGPKFDADEILGLEKAVQSKLGKELAGVVFSRSMVSFRKRKAMLAVTGTVNCRS